MTQQPARLSIRIDLPNGRFGPGKAALLRAIVDTGSISAAARALKMSYARAWSLTEEMNTSFGSPLLETFTGGNRRGGTRLSEAGERVLEIYDRISERASLSAARDLEAITAIDLKAR